LKDPVQKPIEEILSAFSAFCEKCSCFLSNENRQVYVLPVIQVKPENRTVLLELPGGRTKPLDVSLTWQATLRVRESVGKMNVESISIREKGLLVKFCSEVMVSTPRSYIRMAADSRSPVFMSFESSKFSMEGVLTDFGVGGAGLRLESNPELVEEEIVYKIKFTIRGSKFFVATARVAHVANYENEWHLGLAFDQISESAQQGLKEAIQELKERKLGYLVSVDG